MADNALEAAARAHRWKDGFMWERCADCGALNDGPVGPCLGKPAAAKESGGVVERLRSNIAYWDSWKARFGENNPADNMEAREAAAALIALTALLREARTFAAGTDDGDRYDLLARIDAVLNNGA